MADEDTNEESENTGTKSTQNKPWLLFVIIGLLVLILMGGSVVGALYYAGVFDSDNKTTSKGKNGSSDEDTEEMEDEEDLGDDEEGEGEGKKLAIYVPVDPTFVVNLEGKGRVKFLQVTVEIMTRDETVVESIKNNMPVIRNNLTFLFSRHTYDDVKTIEGKEALRSAALAAVQKIMEEETGKTAVEALYFTSFVTQ